MTKMIKNKKIHKFKEKQNTCFNFVKNKNLKINKEIFLQDKFFTTYNKTNKKIKNTNKKISDFIIKNQKTNKSYKSRDKSKNIKINHSIKNKILKSEVRAPTKKYISNYINKNNKSNSDNNNNNLIEYTTICEKNHNKKKLLDSKSIEKRKKCESIDFSNSEYHHNKYVFTKIDSIKRNSYIYSPKNSFSHFINKNIKNNKMINEYFTERAFLFNQPTMPSQQHMYTISQNDIRSKYKTILLTKNNKKSYDFNSDIQKRYKQNILNKINNLKNKDYCISNIRKSTNSNSIDLNNINYNNRFYSNSLKNKSKEKEKENDNKDLFKKIMSFKINNRNKNKTEEKVAKSNNKINEKKNNNIPMTIKVNTSNFLSKIKEKYKKPMI